MKEKNTSTLPIHRSDDIKGGCVRHNNHATGVTRETDPTEDIALKEPEPEEDMEFVLVAWNKPKRNRTYLSRQKETTSQKDGQ